MNPVSGIYPQTDSGTQALLPLAYPEADCSMDFLMVVGWLKQNTGI